MVNICSLRQQSEQERRRARAERERGSGTNQGGRLLSPVEQDGLDQGDDVSAGVVTGAHACDMDKLEGGAKRLKKTWKLQYSTAKDRDH